MSLPKIAIPRYSVKLQSLPQPVEFRPYLVKEEKLLLMAQASTDVKEIESAVQSVVSACTDGKIDVLKLPTFDLELLFLNLRARSVNNVIEVKFECQQAVDAEDGKENLCGTQVPFAIKIEDINVTVPEKHTNKIWLNEDVGVTMQYPTAGLLDDLQSAENAPEKLVSVIASCIENIFTKSGEVYEAKETPHEEVVSFVESLQVPQLQLIREGFFDTMPYMSHTLPFKCPKCGYTENIVMSGLADFFG